MKYNVLTVLSVVIHCVQRTINQTFKMLRKIILQAIYFKNEMVHKRWKSTCEKASRKILKGLLNILKAFYLPRRYFYLFFKIQYFPFHIIDSSISWHMFPVSLVNVLYSTTSTNLHKRIQVPGYSPKYIKF